jgi:hypothetical protein
MTSLGEILRDLSAYDRELTIYAVKPWNESSVAVVARESDGGGLPAEADAIDAKYFLEIFIASDLIEDWVKYAQIAPTADERVARLIQYAETDA